MTFAQLMESRFVQAVVAGAVVAVGWIVNGWQNRREDARRRAEKLRDYHRALYAEIGAWLSSVGSLENLDQSGQGMVDRMREDPTFVPFMPIEENDTVFRAIVPQLQVLPTSTIDVVVAYYASISQIRSQVEDMRSDRFMALPADRRIAIYRDHVLLKRGAFEYGSAALRLITVYANEGADAAKAERDRLRGVSSLPAGDRSDP